MIVGDDSHHEPAKGVPVGAQCLCLDAVRRDEGGQPQDLRLQALTGVQGMAKFLALEISTGSSTTFVNEPPSSTDGVPEAAL